MWGGARLEGGRHDARLDASVATSRGGQHSRKTSRLSVQQVGEGEQGRSSGRREDQDEGSGGIHDDSGGKGPEALRWAMRGDVPWGGDRRADNAHHDGEQRVELEGTHLLDTMLQIEEDGSSISINKFFYV
jgi:hypothetical protein